MKRASLALIVGLTLTAGSVLALEENAPGTSDRIIKKLLALTDTLQDRVTELEETVVEQKAEIARLKLQQGRVSGPAVPPLIFTRAVPSPNQPQIRQQQLVPVAPESHLGLPPGTIQREINGMRFYIVPCRPESTVAAPTAAAPNAATRVPIRVTVPTAK